jgi:hypothetical protein
MANNLNTTPDSTEDYASLNEHNIFSPKIDPLFGSNDIFGMYPLGYDHSSTASNQSEKSVHDKHHYNAISNSNVFDHMNISKVNSPPQNYLPIEFEVDSMGMNSFTNNPLFLDIPSTQHNYFDPAEQSPCISIDDENGFRLFTEMSGYELINYGLGQYPVPVETKSDENEILRFATDGFGIISKLPPSIFADIECRVINDGIM